MLKASEAWLASYDDTMFSTLFSSNNVDVDQNMTQVEATQGNKPIPVQ